MYAKGEHRTSGNKRILLLKKIMQTRIRTYFPVDGGGVDEDAHVIDAAGADEDFDITDDSGDEDLDDAAGSNEMGPKTVSGGKA